MGRIFNRYYWKQMYQDIAHYCVSCEVCARRKLPRRLEGIPILSPQLDYIGSYGPMECIAIDVIGPITTSGRSSLIIVMVDLYTRYGVAVPIQQQKTQSIVQALMRKWFTVFGVPKAILSDNGPGMSAFNMKACMKAMGVRSRYILPYHPESNGICERLNGTVINMLSSYVQQPENQKKWAGYLDHVVFAYNTSVHTATGYTPYYLVFGHEACIGSEAMLDTLPREFRPYPAYVKEMQRDMWLAHRHIRERGNIVQADSRSVTDEESHLEEGEVRVLQLQH